MLSESFTTLWHCMLLAAQFYYLMGQLCERVVPWCIYLALNSLKNYSKLLFFLFRLKCWDRTNLDFFSKAIIIQLGGVLILDLCQKTDNLFKIVSFQHSTTHYAELVRWRGERTSFAFGLRPNMVTDNFLERVGLEHNWKCLSTYMFWPSLCLIHERQGSAVGTVSRNETWSSVSTFEPRMKL